MEIGEIGRADYLCNATLLFSTSVPDVEGVDGLTGSAMHEIAECQQFI